MKHFMLPRNAVLRDAQQQITNESTMSNYSPNPSSSKSNPSCHQKSTKENASSSDLNALLSSDHNKATLNMKSPLPPRPPSPLKRKLNMEAVPKNSIPTGSDSGVKVTSPYGNNLHHNENVTHGQFAFTTTEAGNYLACFWMDKSQGGEMTLSLDWRIGVAAKYWESVSRNEKIEGVELELLKLEGAVQSICENIIYLKHREFSEATNSRVAWFSIMSLGVCIVVEALQLSYLQRYFQKKKLI